MVQTALLPQQRTGTQGLDATFGRIPPPPTSRDGAGGVRHALFAPTRPDIELYDLERLTTQW